MPMADVLNSAMTFLSAAGALGTAAYGLVDGSKFFRGGISNAGFRHLETALARFDAALVLGGDVRLLETIRANWLNGVPKADQKAAAKSLIRLGITPENAPKLAKAVGVSADALTAAATKINEGELLTPEDMNILGRFDALLEAILDLGYERADQFYRNSAKAASAVVAVILAVVAAWLIDAKIVEALFVGIVATPLAPIAKDIASSLSTAVAALKGSRG